MSFAHSPPTVRVAAVEVAQLAEARQAGADAMERECRRLRKLALLSGYRQGFAHGAWQGFCAALAGMVLGIVGAAMVFGVDFGRGGVDKIAPNDHRHQCR